MSHDVFWPGTAVPKSHHNGFTRGLTDAPVDWARYTGSAALGRKSTAAVERRRKDGSDFSTFIGISKKANITSLRGAPSMMRSGHRGPAVGSGMNEDSKPGRIRSMLADSPMSSAAIAEALGVDVQRAISLMRNDVRQGRIVKIGDKRPLLYALSGSEA